MDNPSSKIQLKFDALPLATRKVFILLGQQKWITDDDWYLAGGTALTLHFGHRESYDLDFFSRVEDFESEEIDRKLSHILNWNITSRDRGTLYGEGNGVKMSFIAYPEFAPEHIFYHSDLVPLISSRDIAVMKIMAISQRGKKRDFYDLYWYTKYKERLEDIFTRIPDQYPHKNHNLHHFLKSLMYFEDAESDSDPTIFFNASWQQVKDHFSTIVPPVAEKILMML